MAVAVRGTRGGGSAVSVGMRNFFSYRIFVSAMFTLLFVATLSVLFSSHSPLHQQLAGGGSPKRAHIINKKETIFSSAHGNEDGGSGDVIDLNHLRRQAKKNITQFYTKVTEVNGSDDGVVIDLAPVNPIMYEQYWKQMDDKTMVSIPGWQFLSYFSDVKTVCKFLEAEFADAVTRLHKLVGNAATEDRYIVVGTGSSQLYQAALYALTPTNSSKPVSVVAAAPFYNYFPLMTDYLKSGLFRWAGDAYNFSADDEPYIEIVTSPSNPVGTKRQAVVNRDRGITVHDLVYYWPQYTPISHLADHSLMLFSVSKVTGHAGTRIGWALVKDREIAKKMTKFIVINTIGVSRDSQLRAAKILQVVSDGYGPDSNVKVNERFFEYSYSVMVKRWKELRAAVNTSTSFSLPKFSPEMCAFSGQSFEPHPAFAWLKCEEETVEDCETFLRSHNIILLGGKHFGGSPKYARISMVDTDNKYKILNERLSTINS